MPHLKLLVTQVSRLSAVAIAVSLCLGCAHHPLNMPLLSYEPGTGYRFDPLLTDKHADELFICLTFSGGGTRAAALAFGVLQKLRATSIIRGGQTRSLLEEVDCISSVSGGSFTAAYYALYGDRVFEDFYERFLTRNIERALVLRTLHPANLYSLMAPFFGRSEIAEGLYHDSLFGEATYASLIERRRRPFLIVNATNMGTGARFEFTQEQFDFIGSDLAHFRIARAVAASSAFPVLLTPVTIINYGAPREFSMPLRIYGALEEREVNPRRYRWARDIADYLDKARRPFVHLLDGGLADNIGLEPLVTAAYRGFIRDRLTEGSIKRLVIVVVNAKTAAEEDLSRRAETPGTIDVVNKAVAVPMDRLSFETIQRARQMILTEGMGSRRGGPRMCFVEVGFESVADRTSREYLLGLPTTLALPEPDVKAVIQAGQQLLEQSPDFQRLLRALRGEPAVGTGVGEDGNCS